jgi:DNA-binding transcriptional MocR family regulator
MTVVDARTLADMLGPWRDGAGPLGEKLGRRLVVLVDKAALPDGTRLPPERALATRLAVSRSTATAAYRLARGQGRIESRQGAGSWVRGPGGPAAGAGGHGAAPHHPPDSLAHDEEAFSALGRAVDGVVDLSLAEPPCDGTTRAVLSQLDPDWLAAGMRGTGYHPQGLAGLREGLAGFLATIGHHATPDRMMVTTGAQQAISLTASVICPPGSTVLVEEATYPGALGVFRRMGLRVVPISTDQFGPVPEVLAELCTRTRPALVYLIPVGSNPAGTVIPPARLDALADVLSRHGTVLAEDRTAAPLAEPARVPAPLATRLPRGRAVVVGSVSKIAWSGIRVGWVIAPPELMRELLSARIGADLAASLVSQLLTQGLVPRLPQLAATARTMIAEGQATLGAALARHLPEWEANDPQAGAWRWVRVPGDARLVARAAAAAGVLVTPGPVFSPHALLTDHLRIACVSPADVLVDGVSRLGRAWEGVARATHGGTDDGRDLLII